MKHTTLSRSPASKKLMHHSPGFTMVELILTIAIATILMAIAIPQFQLLAYGPSSNRATLELLGVLQKARLQAIRTHQRITVEFNKPLANQVETRWFENGVIRTEVHNLSKDTARVSFDKSPPGPVSPPDVSFDFTNLGFIEPNLGNPTGNIYLIDNVNKRRYGITTTIAGGIIERQWDGKKWNGPTLTIP